MCLAEALLESVSLSVGPLNVVTRPRLWLKTTSEKGPHLSCVVFTEGTGMWTGSPAFYYAGHCPPSNFGPTYPSWGSLI